jgi:hypothetical protein
MRVLPYPGVEVREILNSAGNVTFNVVPTERVLRFLSIVLAKLNRTKRKNRDYALGPTVWYLVPSETEPDMVAKVDKLLSGRCLHGLARLPSELEEDTVIQQAA